MYPHIQDRRAEVRASEVRAKMQPHAEAIVQLIAEDITIVLTASVVVSFINRLHQLRVNLVLMSEHARQPA